MKQRELDLFEQIVQNAYMFLKVLLLYFIVHSLLIKYQQMYHLELKLVIIISLCVLSYGWCEKSHLYESDDVNQIDISPDGTMFVTASDSRKVIVWNFKTMQPIFNFSCGSGDQMKTAKFSKDQKYLAAGDDSGKIWVYRITAPSTFTSVTSGTAVSGIGDFTELDFNYLNTKLMVCGTSGYKFLAVGAGAWASWTATTVVAKVVSTCKFQKDQRYAIGQSGGTVTVFLPTNVADWTDTTLTSCPDLDFDRGNGSMIVGSGSASKYRIFNTVKVTAPTVQLIHSATTITSPTVTTVSYSKEGSIYAVGGQNTLLIFQNRTQNLLFNWTSSTSILAGVFSYDSQYYLTAGTNGLVRIFKRNCQSCPAGTFENSTSCLPCQTRLVGCTSCANATYCYTCGNGYGLSNPVTNINFCFLCHSFMPGCIDCNTTTYCRACSSFYFLTSNNCSSCQLTIQNCLTCSSSSACTLCISNYFVNATNKCQPCTSLSNCMQCINSTTCIRCVSGLYLNSTTYNCAKCPTNCTSCYNSTSCTQCIESQFLNGSYSCQNCQTNCLACNSSTYCYSCIASFYFNGSSCIPCSGTCNKCINSTYCQSCVAGYHQDGGSCKPCQINCLTCINGTACLTCLASHYYQPSTNSCLKCQNLFERCMRCSNTTCLNCQTGFYLQSSICTKCQRGYFCQSCLNSTFCLSCMSGFYLNAVTGVCTPCGTGCSACANSTTCINCLPKYYFSNGLCTICPANCPLCTNTTYCLSCLKGFYLNSSNNCRSCKLDITNCETCTSAAYCSSCQLGYKLNLANSSCTRCSWPCSLCDSYTCRQCAVGYFINSGSCSACSSECTSCSSTSVCFSCVQGYYLSTTNTCISCNNIGFGCSTCNRTTCFKCLSHLGFYLNSSTLACTSCSIIPNCLQCNSILACTQCSFGYYLDGTTCKDCSQMLSNCKVCNSSTCLSCMDPYYLTSSGCSLCTEGCSVCTGGSTCTSCFPGYLLQGTSCTFCNSLLKGCQICTSSSVCTECADGYLLSGSFCVSCSSLMNGCYFCNGTTTCSNCLDQYYMNSTNSCLKCQVTMVGCSQCNSSSVCLSCLSGFYKTSTNLCSKCNDTMCIYCSNSSFCYTCVSGYYADNSGVCTACNSISSGCILCNTTKCLQCTSGYYLSSTNQCSKCLATGCEVCEGVTSACVTCSSLYFLNSTKSCVSCGLSLQGCLHCTSAALCTSCLTGYYLTSSFVCQPCLSLFKGCAQCTSVTCTSCQGGYIMNSTTCQSCLKFIPGCQYCLSFTTCLSCQSGYFTDGITCIPCTNLTGCLDCASSTECNLCSQSYYLNTADDLCYSCSTNIPGCVTCFSSTVCKSCLGNYALSGGYCSELKAVSIQPYTQLRMVTQYVSNSKLLHRIFVHGSSFAATAMDLASATTITMVGTGTSVTLTILSFEWPDNDYEIDFYTNNPLGADFNSMVKAMPLARRLNQQEEALSNQKRNLFETNVDLNYKFQLQMSESAIQTILPSSSHSGSLSLKSLADDPTFLKSVYSQTNYQYHYIGFSLTIFMLIVYLIKAAVSVPKSDDQGQIISHILLTKTGGIMFGLAYMQYMDYCYGFSTADLPWLNTFTSFLSSNSDLSPNSYLLFYSNMTLASTFLSALGLISLIALILLILGYFCPQNRPSLQVIGVFFYNFFQVGLIVAGSASIQGAYYNNLNVITKNSIYYIIGILVFIIVGVVNIWMTVTNIFRINKIRVMVKATFLSLIYISPIYLLPVAAGVEVIFILIEYKIKKATKLHPHLWLTNQILINLSLAALVLLYSSLLSIFLSAALIIAVLMIDLYVHISEYKHQQQLVKVKQIQQLTSMLENQQKINKKIKKRNNALYQNTKTSQFPSVANQMQVIENNDDSFFNITSRQNSQKIKAQTFYTLDDDFQLEPKQS